MDIDADAQAAHSPIPQIHRLHRCQRQRYHMNFLASQGLLAHMDHYPIGKPQSSTNQLTLTEKGGGKTSVRASLTMKQMLALPVTDCPPPAKHYDYPICQVQMGRKALSTHLRKEHQADRPSNFPFWPDRDMLPGRLA